jgi:ADP-heptose:LPS heptosyltransferase
MYYAECTYIPKGWETTLRIEGNERNLPNELYDTYQNTVDPGTYTSTQKIYAVITTNAVTEVRRLPSKTINELIEYFLSKNITPVFLGKKEMHTTHRSSASDDINFHKGIDLREKTSLMEAACVLANAKIVVGLDNGLLHLACCSDVPIVFGFSTINPSMRIPIRHNNAKIAIVAPPEALKCRYCQTNMKYLVGHDFAHCLYKDIRCAETLTSQIFIIQAIESII